MRINLTFITPVLAAGAAAAAIAAAPMAVADPPAAQTTAVAAAPAALGAPPQVQQSCTSLGGSQTQCQSPGNVQLNDSPPQVNYFPLGDS
ncbi:hypothetical protein CIW52_22740 [Mycolicibacterium sp. P9-64]|uniref:hypothetical protein n=1 Tax=Mycolicibacterium sp. P9-64 TaxID=2024612 RepID=UPI0011F04792|nr:hypothetical protein [Mycolicibacterium sp. P9-64]KAA0080455.1 hypothetical protein CIW52_22740 [Mycolicibacterium sp. P9-64]